MTRTEPADVIGLDLGSITVSASRFQLAWFADVVGYVDPVYRDVAAANLAGYPDLPVPPTFFFSLEFALPDRDRVFRELGVDMRQVLHGEQRFSYHSLAFAGEELTITARITDYYERKGGALKFVRRESEVGRGGQPVATTSTVTVVRELDVS